MQKAVADPNRRHRPDRAGARAFRQLRLTSVALIILVPYALFVIAGLAGKDVETVRQTMALPFNGLAMLVLVAIGVWHMWLGMREILEDYVTRGTLRLMLLANAVFCAMIAALTAGALLKLWLWS